MATTARGHIEQLPSGSFRVHVYAGTDPVTGKPRRLKQTCPDEASAAAVLGKLLAQADGDHFPNREATLGQVLAKYLEVADLEVSTQEAHEGYIRRTIGPVLGEVKIRKLGADSLDSLYTALKKCSRLCRRLPRTEHYSDGKHSCDGRCGPLRDHRTTRPHACDSRCRPHACRPMKSATILRVYSIISSALDLAVRYDWADRNVAKNASPPHPRKREPDPPSPDQAARLLNLVWAEDEEFGLYLWTAFTTGARRGEVSALRENRFDFTRQQVRLARNYLVKKGQHIEKAPKDGEGRVLSLDLLTCELFQERFQRRRVEARTLGVQLPEDAFAFSPDPAGRTPWNPDTMTHRYRRYARRVGIASSLKELRHYSATQLLSNGVDLNTVAGRLGHAEGSTTLKFYAQFTRPADQQAAAIIPASLDGLRRKERLRELYLQSPNADLEDLAATLGPATGLDQRTALAWLAELTASGQPPSNGG
jgi:integrase